MASIALIKHAVSRSYSMGKQAERDLKDTEDSLFASLACDASPVVVAGNASAFYRAHQAAAATIAFQSAVNKSGREYSSAAATMPIRSRLAIPSDLHVTPLSGWFPPTRSASSTGGRCSGGSTSRRARVAAPRINSADVAVTPPRRSWRPGPPRTPRHNPRT